MNILILILFVTFIGYAIYIRSINDKKYKKALQLDGLVKIKNVKTLIYLLQTHRGLSAADDHNDQSVKAPLLDQKTEICRFLVTLDKEIKSTSRYLGFEDHWQRFIHQDSKKLTISNSFKQHTHMISNLLFLLEELANQHNLNKAHLEEFQHVNYLWRELLMLQENLGQARALGSSALTKKYCSDIEAYQLKQLRQSITLNSEHCLKKLGLAQNTDLFEQALKSIRNLSSIIVNNILQQEELSLSRTQYFSIATEAMDSLENIFSQQLASIEQSLLQAK